MAAYFKQVCKQYGIALNVVAIVKDQVENPVTRTEAVANEVQHTV
jgi:hypothetical protein